MSVYQGGHNEKIKVNKICTKFCPSVNQTTLTYVRHDFLVGVHGKMHFKSAVCDHWLALAEQSDIVLISSAAHINELVEYPREQPATPGVPFTTYIDESARIIANKLKKLKMKPNSVIVYLASSAGIMNFTNDCSLKPESRPLPYDSMYNWDKVPYMQTTYVTALQQAMHEVHQPFLVIDLQYLMQMRRGCRGDFVHSVSTVKDSPYFNVWLLLHNLMLEYHKSYKSSGEDQRLGVHGGNNHRHAGGSNVSLV